MAQRKPQGHYCKICRERKSNESFRGKGHAAHICKACSRLSSQQQAEQMTLNRLSELPMRYLSNTEVKWLKNRTTPPHSIRPASIFAKDAGFFISLRIYNRIRGSAWHTV